MNKHVASVKFTAWWPWSLALVAYAVSAEDLIQLVEDRRVSAAQRASDEAAYLFEAAGSGAYLIDVEQQGLDFSISVTGPDGSNRSYNSPLGRNEHDYVLLEPPVAARYRISIASREPTDATGAYSIRISKLPISDSRSEEVIAAWRSMSDGAAAYVAKDAVAVTAYQNASLLWEKLGKQRLVAQATYSIAMIEYWKNYDWSAADTLARKTATLYRDLGEESLYASALYLRALAQMELANEHSEILADANFQTAFDLFDQAQAIHEARGNVYDLAHITNNRGLAYFNMGNYEQAEALWNLGVEQFNSIKEWREEFLVRQNLAVIDIDKGYGRRAINSLTYIVDNFPADRDPELEAIVLDNLGKAHILFGDIDKALQAYTESLTLHRRIDDRMGEGVSLKGLGNSYFVLGELELANQYLVQALPIAIEANDSRNQSSILMMLGNISYLAGDFSRALERHESSIQITPAEPARAYRMVLAARDLRELGRVSDAIEQATAALELAIDAGVPVTRANALEELGYGYSSTGDYEKGAGHYMEALRIYESLGLRGSQADVLHGLAMATRAQGNLVRALEYSEASLVLLEGLRERVAAPELRAFYSATRLSYYEAHIDLLMELHSSAGKSTEEYLHAAVHASERARARMMLDLLTAAAVDLEQAGESELVERRGKLYEELAARQYQRDQLLSESMADPAIVNKIDALVNQMTSIENELNVIEIEIRRSSPNIGSIRNSRILTAQEIQGFIGENAVLLQYTLGRKRSFVWVIAQNSICGIELSNRDTIESLARSAYGELTGYQRSPAARRRLEGYLRDLSEHVLTPVAQYLDAETVLIAADGALHYIPFSVLPLETDGEIFPLASTREVVAIPSVSVLAAQRARANGNASQKTIAIFADPVFGPSDPRLGDARVPAAGVPTAPNALLTRSSIETSLTRLSASGREARAIARMVPENERFVRSGFRASREEVLRADLSQYHILHFATHGLVDSRYPALSALALSQFDEYGRPQDGFLRLHDIYDLDLNADLVVLSACETALGREIRGEGLVGLTQGFIYAGARSLVVSLWKVPDNATSELMTQFYDFMLYENARPAAALVAAQLSIRSIPRWSNPYFWGAFVLFGDWRGEQK